MATAVGAGFDVSKLLDSITKADKALTNLMDKNNQASRSIISSFQQIANQGVVPYTQSLEKNLSIYNSIRDAITDTSGKAKSGFRDMKSEIDKVITSTETLMTSLSMSPQFKYELQVKAARDYRDQMVRIYTEMFDTIEKRTTQNQSAKHNSQAYAQNYQQQLSMYERMFDEIDKKEQAYNEQRHKNNEQQKKDKLKQLSDEIKAYQEYQERVRALQEAQAKRESDRRRRSYDSAIRVGDTSDNALNYANRIYSDKGVMSINNMNKAIQKMRDAQSKLNLSTEDGRKKYDELERMIGRVQKKLDSTTKSAKQVNEAHKELVNTTSRLEQSIAAAFSLKAITGYAIKVSEVRGEFERQHKALQVLTKDVDEANRLWTKTINLAVKSPFRVKELVTYTKQLAAYRVETSQLYEKTKMLADISAGLGVDMNRLILAYGQVKAANYLRGTELRQFSEAGINILKELSEYYEEIENRTVSVGDVFDMVSKRMVSFADVDAVLQRVTGASGQFYRMQEEQSETIRGMIMNLYDSVDLMLDDIGEKNDGIMRGAIRLVKSLVDNWEIFGNVATPIFGFIIARMSFMKILHLEYKKHLSSIHKGWSNILVTLTKSAEVAKRFRSIQGIDPKSGLAAGLSVALLIIGKIVMEIAKYRARIKEINKEYQELNNTIGEIKFGFSKAIDDKDFDKQKEKLKELVSLANKEYNMNIKINVKGMSESDVKSEFDKISQQLMGATAFSSIAAKEFEEGSLSGLFENRIKKDLEQFSDAYVNTYTKVLNQLPHINYDKTALGEDYITELAEAQSTLRREFNSELETESQYYERIVNAYEKILKLIDKKAAKEHGRDTIGYENAIEELSNIMHVEDVLLSLRNKEREAAKETTAFYERIRGNLSGNVEQDQKWLKSIIDRIAAENKYDQTVRDWMYKMSKKVLDIEIRPVLKTPEPEELKPWQKTYNELFKDASAGFKSITSTDEKQETIVSRLQDDYKDVKELIDRINQAGGYKATLIGGAYEGEDLDLLKKKLSDIQKQIEWFGANTEKNKKTNNDSMKDYISLIKEMRSEFVRLNKDYDVATSKQKVLTNYADAFKKTFSELGLSLNTKLIDSDKIEELRHSGEISEEVALKMEELAKSGTHIRDFSESAVEAIKKFEGFRGRAYNIGDGRWTIGYGETQGVKQGDVMTQEEADAKLRKRLTEDFAKSLNKVLDLNQDIVLTQEQYNALLDLTYQGGASSVERLLLYAKETDKGVEHIKNIYEKVKTVFGENDAERFGEAFVNKFKDTENIYERISMLLKTMNLTVNGGQLERTLYHGMLERSDIRSAIFASGKEMNEIYEKAILDFSNIDVSDAKGVVDFLEKLKPYAEKAGSEAMELLLKTIAKYKDDINLDSQVLENKNLFDQIEDIFSNYEISLEMDKLNIPSDLAQKSFGFESIDLNEIRGKVLEKFGLGSMVGTSNQGIYDSEQFKAMSKERQDELRKSLEKEEELQDKSLKERMNRFVKFLKDSMNEIVVVQTEHANDISFASKLFDEKRIDASTYTQVIKRLVHETNSEISKIKLEKFKESSTYIAAMGDLSSYSKKKLQSMLNTLKDVVAQNAKFMSADEIKAYYDSIENINEAFEKLKMPWSNNNYTDIARILELEKQITEEKAKQAGLERQRMLFETQIKQLETTLQTQKKSGASQTDIATTMRQISTIALALQGVNGEINATSANISSMGVEMEGLTNGATGAIAIVDKIIKEVYNSIEATKKIFDDVKALADSYGADVENETWTKWSSAMETMGNVNSEVMQGWENLKSGNIMGAIANTVGSITKLLQGINEFKDIDNEKEIERQQKRVEILSKAYQKLEKDIEDAYTFQDRQSLTADATAQLEEQITALEAANAKEEAMKNKDQDQIDANSEKIKELEEKKKELERGLKEDIGWNYDYASIADEFVEAWAAAFQETGDGLKGLTDNFEKFKNDIIKKQVSSKIISSMLHPFLTWVEEEALKDYDITDNLNEFDEQYALVAGNINSALTALNNSTGAFNATNDSELSGLQKGIQGITENQADILAAYWSAVRFDVSAIRQRFDEYMAAQVLSEDANPMMVVLNSQLEQLKAIRGVLDDAITGGDSTAGAFRVRVVEMN